MKTVLTTIFAMFGLISAAIAQPAVYDFDYTNSDVTYTYTFAGNPTAGSFPVFSGDLLLDLKNVENSKVSVTLNATKARAGFAFATQAMKGPKVLNAKDFPNIVFQTKSVKMVGETAEIKGTVTLRGVTKPIVLEARFFRAADSDPTEVDDLTLSVTGRINRHDFGASGFKSQVGPYLDIKVLAKIKRRGS